MPRFCIRNFLTLFLGLTVLIFSNSLQAEYPATQTITFADLQANPERLDTTHTLTLDKKTLNSAHFFSLSRRPEFVLVYRAVGIYQTFFGIVPRNSDLSGASLIDQLAGQQVVQWQITDFPVQKIKKIEEYKDGSRLKAFVQKRKRVGKHFVRWAWPTKLKKLFIPNRDTITPIVRQEIIDWALARPLFYQTECGSTLENFVEDTRFNDCRIMGPDIPAITWRGNTIPKLDALEESKDLLNLQKVIVPGKEKGRHPNGTLFFGKMTVDNESPYSGYFAPGEYYVFGRLSSGMRDLNLHNEDGTRQKNSFAFGFMVFKTPDQLETPGFFFTQDSLNPKVNFKLQDFATTNNPFLDFKNLLDLKENSRDDIFDLVTTGIGVAAASLLDDTDSARGLRANYRSILGMTRMGVDVSKGEKVITPPHIAITVSADSYGESENLIQVLGRAENFEMSITVPSESGLLPLAKIHDIQWMGFDSHEISFPHARSGVGAIDPLTMRASF
ncbi:MAG: hypothetical protein AAF203_08090, partial [Pseudomonadota bacterium]